MAIGVPAALSSWSVCVVTRRTASGVVLTVCVDTGLQRAGQVRTLKVAPSSFPPAAVGNLGATEGLILLPLVALYGWRLVWVYRDAEARGRRGLLIALLVALFAWPFGLVIWLVARPA